MDCAVSHCALNTSTQSRSAIVNDPTLRFSVCLLLNISFLLFRGSRAEYATAVMREKGNPHAAVKWGAEIVTGGMPAMTSVTGNECERRGNMTLQKQ
jgi:hypothetical protein